MTYLVEHIRPLKIQPDLNPQRDGPKINSGTTRKTIIK